MTKMVLILASLLGLSYQANAADLIRVGNLKFAHYGAISYLSEICGKYNLKVEERVFAKGIDIMPAIIAGEIDVAASAADAAISGRASGVPIFAVAGFAKGGARIVIRPDAGIKSVKDFKGKKVGVARGGAQELLLLAELSKVNLTWSDKPGKGRANCLHGFRGFEPSSAIKKHRCDGAKRTAIFASDQ